MAHPHQLSATERNALSTVAAWACRNNITEVVDIFCTHNEDVLKSPRAGANIWWYVCMMRRRLKQKNHLCALSMLVEPMRKAHKLRMQVCGAWEAATSDAASGPQNEDEASIFEFSLQAIVSLKIIAVIQACAEKQGNMLAMVNRLLPARSVAVKDEAHYPPGEPLTERLLGLQVRGRKIAIDMIEADPTFRAKCQIQQTTNVENFLAALEGTLNLAEAGRVDHIETLVAAENQCQ
eukprot:UC1_evm2s1445